jgi:regulatory protein
VPREGSRGRRGRAGRAQGADASTPLPPLARARAIALRSLAVRARTEAQLRARLAREDLSDQADEVMGWLRGLGYLDDDAYALAHARGLLAPGQLGPLKVERRLVQAGVPAARARAVIRQVLGGEDGRAPATAERELCRTLAERRARRPLGDLDERERARLARFLAGRGFGGTAVAAVLGLYVDGEA